MLAMSAACSSLRIHTPARTKRVDRVVSRYICTTATTQVIIGCSLRKWNWTNGRGTVRVRSSSKILREAETTLAHAASDFCRPRLNSSMARSYVHVAYGCRAGAMPRSAPGIRGPGCCTAHRRAVTLSRATAARVSRRTRPYLRRNTWAKGKIPSQAGRGIVVEGLYL